MGNIQTGDKQSKTGKSPAKGKHFIRNLNRKSPGRESKKHGRKKSDIKRDAIDREYDKTPDSDNIEAIEASDNDTAECAFIALRGEGVQSEVTGRCERSPTRDQPTATSPANESTSESVFTDPLTPLAVELNQCYYSAESDSAHEEPARTLTPSQAALSAGNSPPDMPHDTTSLLSNHTDKQEKSDVFDDSDRDEKAMGSILSVTRSEQLERSSHECSHDFLDNRLKASAEQTSFTLSKHRKVELLPVTCEPALAILNSENDRRHSSVSDVPLESNVLRKVASLTLDKHSESKVVRPRFVPEKLDFQLYEKFEGQMLLNWFLSSIAENNPLKNQLNPLDLKTLGIQYCTHLLAAGVLRQIADRNAPSEKIFKPNLMYYWAHMEVPASQPVTPGRLHKTAWPPDREVQTLSQENLSNRCNIDSNKLFNQNNNEEISDIKEAKVVISQLKQKLQELEFQLEKYKITAEIDVLNKNLETHFHLPEQYQISKSKTEYNHKEIQTSNFTNEINKISYRPVINLPDIPLKTNIDNSLALSNIPKGIENKIGTRSDKIENYCKLNKSRDYNESFKKGDVPKSNDDFDEVKLFVSNEIDKSSDNAGNTVNCESSSDVSFVSTLNSSELISSLQSCESDKLDEISIPNKLTTIPTTILYENAITRENKSETSQSSSIELNALDHKSTNLLSKIDTKTAPTHPSTSEQSTKETHLSLSTHSPPPPLPGMSPQPPPMPGTIEDETSIEQQSHLPTTATASQSAMESPTQPAQDKGLPETHKQPQTPEISPPRPPTPEAGLPNSPTPEAGPPRPSSPSTLLSTPDSHSSLPPILDIGPLHSVSGIDPRPESGVQPPPLPEILGSIGPPSSRTPEIDPPALPIPQVGPPPPPMPGMDLPLPPTPGTGPPPPPMPGMGPPPPPMPGMGPPPPPMPGMGPPPPPMPGMGPPPPPMPGIDIPPPSLPGAGPIAPPMPGSGPPPPPGMPGSIPPPPLASGPVPFPAPPVGGWGMQRSTLRKTPVIPAAPMKPLYWTRIIATQNPTHSSGQGESESPVFKPLWLEIDEAKLDNIDEFTDLFSRQVVKAPVKKKVEVKTKIKPVKILDSKRSQNVGILAQSLHVEFSEIENAIYNFDTSVVSLEALQQIYELRASEEELFMIKEHLNTKPQIPLDKPENFLYDLSGIPNFAERITCFMFQAEFEDAISTTMHKLDNLKHTCEFLTSSESLKKLFAIILTLGNYMNGGNGQRGQADGFGLEILSKLKDVKSKQSNVTLLHFIARTYMRASGGALSEACALPVPEPGDVARAAALDFADVANSLAALHTQFTACKDKTQKVIETDDQSQCNADDSTSDSKRRLDVFKEKMCTFLNAAEEKLKAENENLEDCRNKFIATIKFYQYTPKCGKIEDCEPKEFFSLWTTFCSDFKDIYKKEEQIAIKEKLKEAKKLQDERKSLTQPKKEGGLKARLQKLTRK